MSARRSIWERAVVAAIRADYDEDACIVVADGVLAAWEHRFAQDVPSGSKLTAMLGALSDQIYDTACGLLNERSDELDSAYERASAVLQGSPDGETPQADNDLDLTSLGGESWNQIT